MEHERKLSRADRLSNLIVKLLLRVGVGPKHMRLVTVVGRKTGKPYTTPLTVVETDGQRWLVAPYSRVSWAKNAAASGTAKLSRGRVAEQVVVEPVDARESAPVLKAYVRLTLSPTRAFEVGPDASLEEFGPSRRTTRCSGSGRSARPRRGRTGLYRTSLEVPGISKPRPIDRGFVDLRRVGGDEGTRTPDPRDANAVLSQLSYIPTRGRSLAQPSARGPNEHPTRAAPPEPVRSPGGLS